DQHSNWDIYHITNIFAGGDFTDNLIGFLRKMRQWHDEHPNHEVITLWLEMKDGWETGGHKPVDLDATLSRELFDAGTGRSLIYTPVDMMNTSPRAVNLQQAVTNPGSAWPTLSSLAGKFIVVLHGDNDHLKGYLWDVNYYRPGSHTGYF